jgi:hypothetical protein
MTWHRDEIDLGMLLTKDPYTAHGDAPLLYRVVALIDDPVAVIEPADVRDGEEREYHVITSRNFAEFRMVHMVDSEGTVQHAPPPYVVVDVD